MYDSEKSYKCKGCSSDLFKVIQENTLFDENNTTLFKIICAKCGEEIENEITSKTLMILDNTKDKINNLQMSMKTVLNQFNDIIKSKSELKETEQILKSIDYITSIQQTIISLQKNKLISNVFNSAYIIMHNLPKNVEVKDDIVKIEENNLFYNIPLKQVNPPKKIGNVEIKGFDEKTIRIKVSTDIDGIKMYRSFDIYKPLGVYEVLTYLDMEINYPQKTRN